MGHLNGNLKHCDYGVIFRADLLQPQIIFEKKLNIQAGNGYFNNKKDKYRNSDVQEVVKCLANSNKEDWVKEDIEKSLVFYGEFSRYQTHSNQGRVNHRPFLLLHIDVIFRC